MELQCYCINLESDHQRREHCASEYERAGLPFTVVAATDGRKQDIPAPSAKDQAEQNRWNEVDRGAMAFGFFNRGMNSAERACSHSHYRVWERISKAPSGWYMVNEDDFKLHEIATLPHILEEMKHCPFDLVYLGYRGGQVRRPSPKRQLQQLWHQLKWWLSARDIVDTMRKNAVLNGEHAPLAGYSTLAKCGMTWGGHAYCLTPRGATMLMSTNRNLRFLPDEALRFAILEGSVRAGCSIHKPFACEEDFGSHLRSEDDHHAHHQQFPSE